MAIKTVKRPAVTPEEKRARAFDPVGDQLDAIWKLIAELANKGIASTPETSAMLARIEDIKVQHPKATKGPKA